MKLLYLIDYFDPSYNYREVYYAKHSSKHHQIYILTSTFGHGSKKPLWKPGKYQWNNVVVIRCDPIIHIGGVMFFLKGFKSMIRDINPDMIYTFDALKISTAVMALWASQQDIPIIYEQENRILGGRVASARFLHLTIGFVLEKLVLTRARLIRVCTPGAGEYVKKVHKITEDKIIPSSLGYPKDLFYPSSTLRNRFRNRYGISDEHYVIGVTGKFAPWKKIETIIDAFLKVKQSNVNLIITGCFEDKKYEEFLRKKYVHEQIIFNNTFLNHEQLNEFYNGIDLAVWSHATISYFEALGTHTPIVIPYFNATSHVGNTLNGVYYYGKDDIIFDHQERIINSSRRVDEICNIIQQRPDGKGINPETFSWDNILSDFNELIHDLS